jgi:hypothetical protein
MAPPPSKLGLVRKIGIVKIAGPKAKARSQGTFEIELALAKPIGVPKKFCLLDVAALSHGVHVTVLDLTHVECPTRVPTFDNLGDNSLLDVRETTSPKRVGGKRASPPPSAPGEFLCFSFALSPRALMTDLQLLPSLRLRSICHWRIWTKT